MEAIKVNKYKENAIRILFMFLVGLMSYWQIFNNNNGLELLAVMPFSDAYLYHYSAWFKATISEQGHLSKVLSFSPYELVLTNTIKLFGNSNLTPFIVNSLLSILSCLSLINISLRMFNKKVAIICASLYLFCSPILFFSGTTLKTNLVILFASLSYWSAFHFYQSKKAYWIIIFTVVTMFCAIDRIHILSVLFVFLYVLITSKEHTDIKAKTNYTLVFIMSIVALYSFSAYKYQAEPEYLSPVGLNIYLGHSKPDNWSLRVKGVRNNIIGHREDARKVAEKETKKTLTNSEVTSFWLKKTWLYITSNPKEYIKAQVQKLVLLFSPKPYLSQESYQHWRSKKFPLNIAFVDFSLIFPLFLIGSFLLIKKDKPLLNQYWFSILSGFIYLFSIMSTIVIERYRVTALIFMLPIASYALTQLFKKKYKGLQIFICLTLLYSCSQFLGTKMSTKQTNEWYTKRELKDHDFRKQQLNWFRLRAELDSKPLSLEKCYEIKNELTAINFHRDLKALSQTCSQL